MKINEIISSIMTEQDRTACSLERESGVKNQTIGNARREGANPTIKNVVQILDALGYSVAVVPKNALPEGSGVISL